MKLLEIKKKYKMSYFRKKFNFYLFINKLFNSTVKSGKKNLIINVYLKLLNILLFKKRKLRKSIWIYSYFFQIAIKLLPCFVYVNTYSKGKTILLPWLKKNKKLNKKKMVVLGVNWFNKSFKNRKEKTFFLKFFSELESIRLGKAASLELKYKYYKSFYENKRYIKYLRNRVWI